MTTREAIHADGAPTAAGPYSQGIRAGDLVFTAGQIGIDPATGELVGPGIVEQADAVLGYLRAILEAAGSGLDRLVKVTVYLADIDDWPALNEVYARHVPEPYPARTAFAVRDLPRGARVEIEAVGVVGAG